LYEDRLVRVEARRVHSYRAGGRDVSSEIELARYQGIRRTLVRLI
jgi:hypothetical protein